MDSNKWRLSCCGHPHEGIPGIDIRIGREIDRHVHRQMDDQIDCQSIPCLYFIHLIYAMHFVTQIGMLQPDHLFQPQETKQNKVGPVSPHLLEDYPWLFVVDKTCKILKILSS